MIEKPATPAKYLREIVEMSWRHGSELAAATASAILVALAAFVMPSARLLFVLPPAIAVVLVFAAGMAAWRLHRRQHIALATTRSLLRLNASERADLETHLRSRFQRREARIHQRNEVRLERLAGEIDALQAEILDRAQRTVAT